MDSGTGMKKKDYPNQNLIEVFCVNIDKFILKFYDKGKRPSLANTILKEKKEGRGLTQPNFKTYHKATAIKTVRY